MNRRALISTALLAGPALAVSSYSVSAQTPPAAAESGTIPSPAEFEGIKAAISRTWGLDIEAMIAATPDLNPLDFLEDVTTLTAMVLQFDNAEHARAAHDAFDANLGTQLTAMGQGGTPTVEEGELPDLGDVATTATLKTVSGDFTTWYRFVVVQEAEFTYVLSALAGTEENATRADDLANYVVNEGEIDGSEAIFVAEGGSSGGLWGLLPETGDEVLGNLVPIIDETLYPAP
jgi:hypothetical protein